MELVTGVYINVVYYESMKRKLKIKAIYECRCNERLQTKRFTRLAHKGQGFNEMKGFQRAKTKQGYSEYVMCLTASIVRLRGCIRTT